MSEQELTEVAFQFRNRLEEYKKDPEAGYFSNFPRGRCRDASNIFHRYLTERGVMNIILVSADSEIEDINYSTHAWLEVDGVIVDLTASQFNDRLTRKIDDVYVNKDRDWHDTHFSNQTRVNPELSSENLKHYERITACL